MMTLPLRPLAALALLLLAGCSGGLFTRADPTTLEPEGGYGAARVDTRPLVAEVTAVTLEPTPGGAILQAVALPPTQGFWDIALLRDRSEDQPAGTRRYSFVARPPVDAAGAPVAAPAGPVASRQIAAAVFISDTDLRDLRQITVTGAGSSRTIRP